TAARREWSVIATAAATNTSSESATGIGPAPDSSPNTCNTTTPTLDSVEDAAGDDNWAAPNQLDAAAGPRDDGGKRRGRSTSRRSAGVLPTSISVGRVRSPSPPRSRDRKSTRLNSSHVAISYAVF